MPMFKDYLCNLLSLDLAGPRFLGPRNAKIIRCLRIMIFINCFMLIAFGNIGFYFDANKFGQRIVVPWQVLLVLKILVAVSGGFQLISLPFLIIWRKYLMRKRREFREEQEMERRRNNAVHLPGMVHPYRMDSGRNPTSSGLFDHV